MASSEQKQKIGIFGGTFNPFHNGHLAVLRAAQSRCRLDRIFVIPAPHPPHKQEPVIDFSHRVAMLEAALADSPGISVSLLEAERQAPSYTIDTLQELYERIGPRQFSLIIGADSFMEIHLWYRFTDIFKQADLIVAARPGIGIDDIEDQISSLPGHFNRDRKQQSWTRQDDFHIVYLENLQNELSSSDLRKLLRQGRDVKALLPPAVFDYIHEHGLYGVSDV